MKTRIHTDKAPAAIGPYSQAVLAGDFLYVSGQLPLDPVSGAMAGDTAAEQAEQSIRNLSAILEAAGMTLDDVVKTTVLLADIADFAAVNEVYAKHFTGAVLPARAAFAVRDQGRQGGDRACGLQGLRSEGKRDDDGQGAVQAPR